MRPILLAAIAAIGVSGVAAAQAPNPSQMLQGLLSGNQGQDQAVRDAYERGYQRGRQDESRLARSDRGGRPDNGRPDNGRSDQRGYNNGDDDTGARRPYTR